MRLLRFTRNGGLPRRFAPRNDGSSNLDS